jgi:hypothetical protein
MVRSTFNKLISRKVKIQKIRDSQKDLWNNPRFIPEEGWELNELDLYSETSKYTPDQKRDMVYAFCSSGNLKKAAQICSVPYEDIKKFRQVSPWFSELVKEYKKERQDELDARMSEIIEAGIGNILDRIHNGDTIMNHKSGKLEKRPLSALDMTRVVAILFDKRAMMRGDPTTRTEKVSTEATLKVIMDRMEGVAEKLGIEKKIENSIEGEFEEENETMTNDYVLP